MRITLFLLSALTANASVEVVSNRVQLAVQPFALGEVRLLDGSFKTAQETDRAWLLRIDGDRLLHNFRKTAGLPSSAQPYGGWEDPKCELRGHCAGHYLSACSALFAATADPQLKARVDYLVAELAKCQAAMTNRGFAAGYLAAFPPELFDRADAAKPVWAPYYTLHKIYAGLLDAQEHGGNQQALPILRGMADWLDARFGQLPREQQQKALGNEHGGMAESLAELYARTGEPRYLKLAEAFRHDAVFAPAARGEDKLTGLHANTQFPKFIGYERLYELTGEEAWHTAASNFWTYVARDRSFVIGGNSTHESFFPLDKWEEQMKTLVGPESCNTYNMLRLTAFLSRVAPAASLADFYERGLFNHIRSHQHPGDGNFVYYTSLRPGSYRNYSNDESDFWCCVGTGMENPARFGEALYARGPGRIYVNQFIASEVKWGDQGVTLRQEGSFPAEPRTHIHLKLAAPLTFTLAIRKPAWAGGGFKITVNGRVSEPGPSANGYVELNRLWNDGDAVVVDLPMRLTAEYLPHSTNFVAFLYGPLVLAGKHGREGLSDADLRGQVISLDKVLPLAQVPALIASSADEVLKKLEPMPGKPLEFLLRGVAPAGDVTLAPFASFFDERYTVYWPMFADLAAWKAYVDAADTLRPLREMLAKGSVDFILPHDADNERAHRVHGVKSGHGLAHDRTWRDASDGGWFDYELKIEPGVPQKLVVTYWGGDAGGREFDVIVNGRTIATQALENNRPGEFFDVAYPLPAALIATKDRIVLKFQAHPGKRAGGVFGIRIMGP